LLSHGKSGRVGNLPKARRSQSEAGLPTGSGMKNPIAITRDDVDFAQRDDLLWDFGNKVLYDLCRHHPKHDRRDVIIAKVWLIGRAYAAAIERRRNAKGSSDDFYEKTVAKGIQESAIDDWLSSLPAQMIDPWRELGQVVAVHKRLMDLFADMTGLEKRSLASKYLHFHRPDHFFIYDSRARGAAMKVIASIRETAEIHAEEADPEYLMFVRRCQQIRDNVKQQSGISLTPRQLDKIFLRIQERKGQEA